MTICSERIETDVSFIYVACGWTEIDKRKETKNGTNVFILVSVELFWESLWVAYNVEALAL